MAGSWVALEDEAPLDGVLLEPLAAPELVLGVEEPLGDELELAPPDAESFFSVSVVEEEDDEDDGDDGLAGAGAVLVEPEADPDALPDGVLGVVVPDDAAPELEDEGVRALVSVPALSPQAVSILAPNASDTATARVESLISGPPWLG